MADLHDYVITQSPIQGHIFWLWDVASKIFDMVSERIAAAL